MPFPPSHKAKKRRKGEAGGLSLTSMMDMLTIILLFLLTSYSSEGEILAVDPRRLQLPVSISQEHPKLRLILQITTEEIIVDGEKVTDLKSLEKADDLTIKPLFAALNKNTEKIQFIARNNPSIKFTGEAMIQGDKGIPFQILEKVMYTCGQAGYSNISLAVMSRE